MTQMPVKIWNTPVRKMQKPLEILICFVCTLLVSCTGCKSNFGVLSQTDSEHVVVTPLQGDITRPSRSDISNDSAGQQSVQLARTDVDPAGKNRSVNPTPSLATSADASGGVENLSQAVSAHNRIVSLPEEKQIRSITEVSPPAGASIMAPQQLSAETSLNLLFFGQRNNPVMG